MGERTTIFELLEEGVMVKDDYRLGSHNIGCYNYLISYEDFYEYLKEETLNSGEEVGIPEVQRNWGDRYEQINIPEGTLEILTEDGRDLTILQLIGGNNVRNFNISGNQFDTSRYLLEYKLEYGSKTLESIKASVFTGLIWGFHKEGDIKENNLLTKQLSEQVVGKVSRILGDIDMREELNEAVKNLIRSSKSFKQECINVVREGGKINWENIES